MVDQIGIVTHYEGGKKNMSTVWIEALKVAGSVLDIFMVSISSQHFDRTALKSLLQVTVSYFIS